MNKDMKMQVSPEWQEMEKVNQTAFDFMSSCNLSIDEINSNTMIVCELVENAIKYGNFKNQETVQLKINLNGKKMTVQVSNPINDKTQVYLHELDRMIQWVRGFQDPFEAYVQRMVAIAREPIGIGKSGLGIARITYEGGAILDFFVQEDSTLNVTAVATID